MKAAGGAAVFWKEHEEVRISDYTEIRLWL